jgi:hypothetical protein
MPKPQVSTPKVLKKQGRLQHKKHVKSLAEALIKSKKSSTPVKDKKSFAPKKPTNKESGKKRNYADVESNTIDNDASNKKAPFPKHKKSTFQSKTNVPPEKKRKFADKSAPNHIDSNTTDSKERQALKKRRQAVKPNFSLVCYY